MATSYDIIYKLTLNKLTSFDVLDMQDAEVEDMLHDYMEVAIPKFTLCRKDLDDRVDEFATFNADLNSVEIDILTNYMAIAYIDREYMNTPLMMKAALNSRDFNTFSPANQLDKILLARNTLLYQNESQLSRYAWQQDGYVKKYNSDK